MTVQKNSMKQTGIIQIKDSGQIMESVTMRALVNLTIIAQSQTIKHPVMPNSTMKTSQADMKEK